MLVPINWLKDYVDLDVDIDEFCEKMIMSGSNLETVEYFGENFEKVVVGKVEKKEKHPDADRLSVCMVDVGQEELLQIVCGAPNVEAGMKVPVALHKSRIPGPLHGQPKQEGGVKITKGKLRGVPSAGMICSCGELGFDDKVVPVFHREGIWILPEEAEIGAPVEEAMGLKDAVVDFEITPNRPDCLCMTGMAREAAATFGSKMQYPDTSTKDEGEGTAADYIEVEIKKPEYCSRYAARVITDVKIEQSPWWMQKRLMYSGMRPINNIVDITNFVMLECGQPLHAFDIRQIEGRKIIVDTAKDGEKFTTLDGEERELTSDMLMINDAERSVALAGIMGGLNSEIEEDTTTMLLEAANFDADNIRLTSKALGLRTESSSRFEKGVDPNLCQIAADRVCNLVELLGAGKVVGGTVDAYPEPKEATPVKARVQRINDVLGIDLSAAEMIDIFTSLEMKVEEENGTLLVTPPSVRLDMLEEVDCIEEIARMYGYDQLPVTLPRGREESSLGRAEIIRRKARDCMCAMGADEIQTYSFVDPKGADELNIAEDSWRRDHVVLINPLGEDTSVMRTMLTPAMLEVMARNYSRNIPAAWLYEIGNTFKVDPNHPEALPTEQDAMSIGLYGNGADFFTLKGMVDEMFSVLGIEDTEYVAVTDRKTFHPGRCASVQKDGEELAVVGEIHPDIAEKYGIGERCSCAEIVFGKVEELAHTEISYSPLPKYPSTSRDIALVVDEAVRVGDIERVIRENGGRILEDVALFDIYRGEQVEEGKKSAAFTLTYRDSEKTLTDEEVVPVHEKVLGALKEKFNAVLREM